MTRSLPFTRRLQFNYESVLVLLFLLFLSAGAVSVISGLALFIGKIWVMTVAGIGGYYYMQGQYDDKVILLFVY